ncbi:hypothetical protein RMSM_05257 [Rhodopirellula maiorica SM1]|uniref:Uncharacterized protein n=1 Tax=Rhodopirellula maiorica SM1 TaxID=1265738 RepID=M5REE4_9BACT|nr:hypothetical protein [Rhodopirellula maiorica]EMI17823.1 hypothetical protein RMSM_05257 [Rhodopirellula maiorica SM1]
MSATIGHWLGFIVRFGFRLGVSSKMRLVAVLSAYPIGHWGWRRKRGELSGVAIANCKSGSLM